MKFIKKLMIPLGIVPVLGTCVIVPNLTSCSNSNNVTITFKAATTGIHFESDTVVVTKGTLFKDIPLPKYTLDDGYYFDSWRINNRVIKSDEVVGGNVTISAYAGEYCADGDFIYDIFTSPTDSKKYAHVVYAKNDQENIVIPTYVKDKEGNPAQVREVGGNLLERVSNTKTVFLPHTVNNVSMPFRTGSSVHLTSIVIDPNNESYTSRDINGKECNCIIDIKKKMLIGQVIPIETRHVDIPEGVEYLCQEAFSNNKLIKSVSMPNTIKQIFDKAFWESSVTYAELPDSVEFIGKRVFKDCTLLKTVKLPKKPGVIYDGDVFEGSGLVTVNIPAEMKHVPGSIFTGCKDLQTVNIEYGIEVIETAAFLACTSLKYVYIPDTVTTIQPQAFRSCTSLQKVELPQHLKVIDEQTFFHTPALTDINIPWSLEQIGDNAFENSGISSINIPKTVNYVGFAAFADCSNLVSISVEKGNKRYSSVDSTTGNECNCVIEGDKIIVGCGKTTFPSQVTTIGEGAFFGADIETLTIPDQIQKLEPQAFSGVKCKAIHIGKGLNFIGSDNTAFKETSNRVTVTVDPANEHFTSQDTNSAECNCLMDKERTKLLLATPTSTLPNTITKFAPYCYSYINGPEDLVIPEGVTSIGEGCFINTNNTKSITFPESLELIEEGAIAHCEQLVTLKIKRNMVQKGWPEGWSNGAIKSILRNGTLYTPDSANAKPIILQHWLLLSTDWTFADL